MNHDQPSPVGTILVFTGAAELGACWAGAQLAARVFGTGPLPVGLAGTARAMTRLPSHLSDPGAAWAPLGSALPGPLPYWACTAVTTAVAIGVGVLLARVTIGPGAGTARRRRLGVDTRARLGRARDLRPLVVRGPQPGRLLLGRVGRALVATEDRHGAPTKRSQRRQGDRSAVCIIGPTRCGKTANLVAGILDWDGPAILSSVKTDLLGATLARRRAIGDIKVFDPTRATPEPSASWSPLRAADTVPGAQRAARALTDAAPQGGSDNVAYFLSLARQLLWPILYAAAIRTKTMADVVQWILLQDRPLDDSTPGSVFAILDEELTHHDEARRAAAAQAHAAIHAIWELDDRARTGAYATCQTLIEAWLDPDVAAAAATCSIDVEWLTGGPNTLYLCAPTHEQERLSTVFGGLLGDLLQQAYDRANRTGHALPPTLVVLDEAGNTPTRWLPSVASTCAGIGLLLVTVWQSKAQIDAAYGRLADSVLTNHGTKIIFAGVSDASTLDYAARLLGDEEIAQRSLSTDVVGPRRNVSESTTRVPLVPADVLRQVHPGEALLLHGTLRPAHLVGRKWWQDRRLRSLAAGSVAAVDVAGPQSQVPMSIPDEIKAHERSK